MAGCWVERMVAARVDSRAGGMVVKMTVKAAEEMAL